MIYYHLGLYKGFDKKIEKCLFLPRMVAIGAVIQSWVNVRNSLESSADYHRNGGKNLAGKSYFTMIKLTNHIKFLFNS